jgi:hypothetical protein
LTDISKLIGQQKIRTFKYSPKRDIEASTASDNEVKLNQRLIQVLDEEEDLRKVSHADSGMVKNAFFKEIFESKRMAIQEISSDEQE